MTVSVVVHLEQIYPILLDNTNDKVFSVCRLLRFQDIFFYRDTVLFIKLPENPLCLFKIFHLARQCVKNVYL